MNEVQFSSGQLIGIAVTAVGVLVWLVKNMQNSAIKTQNNIHSENRQDRERTFSMLQQMHNDNREDSRARDNANVQALNSMSKSLEKQADSQMALARTIAKVLPTINTLPDLEHPQSEENHEV